MSNRKPIFHEHCIEIPLLSGLSPLFCMGTSAYVDLDCPQDVLERNWVGHHMGTKAQSRYESGRLCLHRVVMGLGRGSVRGSLHCVPLDGDYLNCRKSNLVVARSTLECLAIREKNPIPSPVIERRNLLMAIINLNLRLEYAAGAGCSQASVKVDHLKTLLDHLRKLGGRP